MDARKFGLIGGGIAALGAGFELFRLLLSRGSLPGYAMVTTDVLALIFIVVLAVTAIGLATHRRFGWGFGVFGFVALLSYGVMIEAGARHPTFGVLYLFLGLALFGCLAKSLPYYRISDATA